MIKFKDYLIELFDEPVPYEHVTSSYDYSDYEFEVNGVPYNVEISNTYNINDDYTKIVVYTIMFSGVIKSNQSMYMNRNSYEMEDEFKGNANKVMSTIVAICKNYFLHNELNKGDLIRYSTDTKSKEKAYKAILTKFLKAAKLKFEYSETRYEKLFEIL